MKRILLVLGISLTAATAYAQDWTPIASGTAGTIRSLRGHFSNVMIAGDSGFVAKSDFTRTVFTTQAAGTTANLLTVISVGGDMISGAAGTYHVYNGTTWFNRPVPDPAEDFVIFSSSNFTAYAAGTGGSIYYTGNAGSTWTFQGKPTTYALHAGADGARAVGDHGTLVQTTDQGLHWNTIPTGTTANLYGLLNDNTPKIVAVGENGTIILSLDGGATWSYPASGTTATLRAIDYSDANAAYLVVVGDHGTVIESTDGGSHWCRLNPGTTTDLYAVAALSNTEFIVAGAGGTVLRTTTAGGSCTAVTAVDHSPLPASGPLVLSGPDPMPLRAHGTVSLVASVDGELRVEVLDVSGRTRALLYDGRVSSGERRTFTLNARGLAPGAYFVRARAGNETSTRGFVILP